MPKDLHQAGCCRAAILRDPAFRAVPELAKAMEPLDEEKFAKVMADLKGPTDRRGRTSNHGERTNRVFRFLEKVRYSTIGERTSAVPHTPLDPYRNIACEDRAPNCVFRTLLLKTRL